MSPLQLSLLVTACATVLIIIFGLPLAWILARRRFPGHVLVETLILLPLVLPPSVVGYYLLLGLGTGGPLDGAGVRLLFTWQAAAHGEERAGGHRQRRSRAGERRPRVRLA
jgi:molybdate transport system permease protein